MKPGKVVVWWSTNVLATKTVDAIKAALFIQKNACKVITVSDMLDHTAASASSFGPRFTHVLRKMIHQYIFSTFRSNMREQS